MNNGADIQMYRLTNVKSLIEHLNVGVSIGLNA